MTRNLVLATAALAAVGFLVGTSPTNAGYVLSGLKEYANAPMKTLTTNDCRAVYNGEVRLVSADAFAKYLAKHPSEPIPAASRRGFDAYSGIAPARITPIRNRGGDCAR